MSEMYIECLKLFHEKDNVAEVVLFDVYSHI